MTKEKKIQIVKLINQLENLENKLNKEDLSQKEIDMFKNQIENLSVEILGLKNNKVIKDNKNKIKSEEEIEENLDEGLPSQTNKYIGMTYKDVLQKALQMENDAIEINLMLLELAPEEDIKKFVEIANDENDHSQIYQGIINNL